MNQIKTQAIILKRMDFGEADRIITVITSSQGKISLMAKGVRRSKSKLAGGLELFSVCDISYIDGRSDLKTVVSTRLDKHFRNIVANIDMTMLAYEALKYIDKATQESCDETYYDLLKIFLSQLDKDKENQDVYYCWFLMRLLNLNGYTINTEKQSDGKALEESKDYNFSYDDMAFYSHESGQYSPKLIKFLRVMDKINDPARAVQIVDAPDLSAQVLPIMVQSVKLMIS